MQIYDYKVQLEKLKKNLNIVESKFVQLPQQIEELEKKQQDPSCWSDAKVAAEISKELKVLTDKQNAYMQVVRLIDDFEAGITLMQESADYIQEKELDEMYMLAEASLQKVWIDSLLSNEYDIGPAIIMLHSGAGGEESQDWAEMLSRMYTRYAERQGYRVSLLDTTPGEGAGIKSATYLIDGAFAYGYLKNEKGVHRLVRLSPFDANNRRHTSFASLEVYPFVENQTSSIKINPDEIKIDTFRSSGAGGQHVNKTESAIRITHLPTGIVVTCQNERSQIQNREMAMKLLASKLMERELAEKEKERLEKLSQNKKIEWGSQIRSYVLHPYSLAKDHRTGYETGNVQSVLDGDIQPFINEYLKVTNNE